jgi:hypothetical protein
MNWKELNKLVINLPERKDRLEAFKQELIYLPCSNLRYVPGIRASSPMVGIGQAHVNCVMIAKQNEWPAVLIMEDDVTFNGKDMTYDHVLSCLENLPPDWNILLGGIYYSKGREDYNKYWQRTGEFCGLHFYIVNSNCYDHILKYDGKMHIDRWMNQKGELNCYVAKKFFATQRGGYSDNVQAKVDYKDKLKKFNLL